MADIANRIPDGAAHVDIAPWGAIWAGVFSFAAIWAVFGMLGAAIFSTAGSTAHPSSGISWGMGVWSIILTMIAMFVGGRVTGHLTGVRSRNEGMLSGTTMFGLAAVSTLVMVLLAGATTGNPTAQSAPYLLGVISSVGWFGWLALFLGWLCAMGGATTAALPMERPNASVRDIRAAA